MSDDSAPAPRYARYTFFEAATQHGYVQALMAPRMEKSRHNHQIIIDPTRGRVFQLFRVADPSTPVFEFVIPERLTTESNLMWRQKTAKALEGQWNKFKRPREIGPGTQVSSGSTGSPITASSTDAPPKSDISTLERALVEPVPLVSVPVDPTPPSSPKGPRSSKPSAPTSRKTASSSRSSSGA